jgi:hypothetical protein
MNKLWRKDVDENGDVNLHEIAEEGINLDKPSVVFFSGLSTTKTGLNFVKGAIGHVEDMLGGLDNGVAENANIYAWQYSTKGNNFKNAFNYNTFPNRFYSKDARKFIYEFMLPMIATDTSYNFKKKKVSGKKRPFKDVEASFNNLTFLAYSYGSVFSQEVYNGTKAVMHDLGFSKKETRLLLSKIHLISMGAVSSPMKEKNRFTSITMVATNDRISKHKGRIWWSLGEYFARAARKLTIKKLSKRSTYISAPVQKDLFTPKQDRQGNIVMRNIRHIFPKWWPRHSYHELPHYTTDRDFDNEFSKIARFALNNSVKREGALLPHKMIAPTDPLVGEKKYSEDEKSVYKMRVAAAMS